jgi:hypothetical protein
MIYIATNCDKKFYENKPKNVIESLLKFKNENTEVMFFQIGFDEKIDGVITVPITLNDIQHSLRTDSTTRENFVCLESGELINFYNFNDNDIMILIDYDIIQQRPFSEEENEFLNNLKDGEFYLTRNEFTEERNSNDEMDIVCMDRSLMEGKGTFKVYNTGCQVARISTWKKQYQEWIKIYKEWEDKCKHHATGQLTINYILHKENMLRELKPSFHAAWFMHGLKHFTRDRHFFVVDELKMVLFNHHAWHSDFI